MIFGQSARTRWEILLKGSTLNRFLEEVRDAAIQVVPLGDADGDEWPRGPAVQSPDQAMASSSIGCGDASDDQSSSLR